MMPYDDLRFNGLNPHQLLEQAVEGTSLIMVGSAPEAGDEYEQALEMEPYAHVMSVNAGCNPLGIEPQVVATLHSGKKDLIGPQYMPVEKMYDALLVGDVKNGWEHERVDLIMGGHPTMGTSAIYAILAAVYLGYERIVVAGCPLTHYIYGSGTTLETWKVWSPMLCQRATSISGSIMKFSGM